MNSSVTTVVLSGLHKISTLTSRELTIEIFMRWKNACEDYFEIKDVKNEKKVTHAGTGLQDLLVQDWYHSDVARLCSLSWDDFTKEFKMRWLSSDWNVKARNELTCRCQTNEELFKD
ncbi:hypothetical protein BDY19DRAFT_907616 [Irpex rosettiformis]|uniref:Uncharacterized protein n=1 Tax=Irpex rosettiformis TaxID=378272 RepID=A0ACB8TZT4_9APHY|nr:hypothetical protein BDY19DRAFT_907616 [Irpex rosettiformis]